MNMIMKQLNFKIVLLFLTIYVCPHRTLAQKDTLLYRTLIQDSILIPQKSQATIEEEEGIFTEVPKHYRKYDKRVHRYRSAWEALIPTHTQRYNMPEVWDYFHGVSDGTMENADNGKPTFY